MSDDAIAAVLDSERIVLARALMSANDYLEAHSLISETDWFSPMHLEVWQSIGTAHATDGTVTPFAVADRLRRAGSTAAALIPNLVTSDGVGSMSYHCDRIAEAACLRAIVRAAQQLMQRASLGHDPVGLAEDTIGELRVIQKMGALAEQPEIDVLDLVARPTGIEDFVIPGLLAPMNRFILTASEGWGKSSLVRQIAACTAAGVHPFKPQARMDPKKVLVIDAENPSEINTFEYRRVYDCLDAMDALPTRGQLMIDECGPMNLLDGRQAARLYSMVERLQPELIAIGPIYQLHEENPNDEGPARKLSAVLDRLRGISRAALVVEAHSPHGDGPQGHMLRPFGASLWKRWPEFGYCLERIMPPGGMGAAELELHNRMRESKLTGWRGARAKRDWPAKLGVGAQLPWEVYP